MTRSGYEYLLGASFFFSLMTVCVKLAGARLPAEQVIIARVFVGLVLSVVAARRAGISIRGHAKGLLVLRGVLGSGGLYCFFYAVTVLPLSEVTTIHYINPIITALLAAIVLGEGIGGWLVVALMVSLTGVVVVARPTVLFAEVSALDPFAVAIALTGALFAAGAYVTVRKLRQTDDPIVVVLWFPIVAMPLFLPLAIRGWLWPTPMEWLLLLGVGVVTQIAQVMLTRGLHLVPAGRGTAVGYAQIVFAMLWGVVIFGESITPMSVLGSVLVIVGMAIIMLTRARPGPDVGRVPAG